MYSSSFSRRFSISAPSSPRFACISSWRSCMNAVSTSSSSTSKAPRSERYCCPILSSSRSTSSACFLSDLTYSSSFALSSALNSLISRSFDWMMRSHVSFCCSMSCIRSCGISRSNSADHFIATAAFCRALDSASYSSFCRRPCRLTSSLIRRSFSRESPTMRIVVTSACPAVLILSILPRVSEICTFDRDSSAAASSFFRRPCSPPSPAFAPSCSSMRLRRAKIRASRSWPGLASSCMVRPARCAAAGAALRLRWRNSRKSGTSTRATQTRDAARSQAPAASRATTVPGWRAQPRRAGDRAREHAAGGVHVE